MTYSMWPHSNLSDFVASLSPFLDTPCLSQIANSLQATSFLLILFAAMCCFDSKCDDFLSGVSSAQLQAVPATRLPKRWISWSEADAKQLGLNGVWQGKEYQGVLVEWVNQ